MKYAFTTCLAVAALLALMKILYEKMEPMPRLIPDMVQQTHPDPLPPPPGVVPHESSPARAPEPPEQLFARRCAACHGESGTGQSYVASQAGMPEVNDLTSTTVTPEELYRTLSEGRGAMPAHAERLSEAERRKLIDYITHTLPNRP